MQSPSFIQQIVINILYAGHCDGCYEMARYKSEEKIRSNGNIKATEASTQKHSQITTSWWAKQSWKHN